jgi:hypothetical protein
MTRNSLTLGEVAVQMAQARHGRIDDMETPSTQAGGQSRVKADQIAFEDFVEVATRAVLRALQSGLNPQPLPPGPDDLGLNPQPEPPSAVAPLNPQPLPPMIVVGLVFNPREGSATASTVER